LSADASQEFISAEKRLADAQTAFIIAGRVLSQAKSARDKEELQSFAQDQYDAAENELNSAQDEYNKLLTNQAVQDVHDGRARVRVAQKRYDLAQDYYSSLLTGTQSLQVKLAEAGVKQAEAALATAKSALAVLDVQLQKTMVTAPIDGIILTRNVEVGSTLAPAAIVMTIGQLEMVNLTVYIPETDYGKVNLDDEVSITVDSFPAKTSLEPS